jgi:hypothetical protein
MMDHFYPIRLNRILNAFPQVRGLAAHARCVAPDAVTCADSIILGHRRGRLADVTP